MVPTPSIPSLAGRGGLDAYLPSINSNSAGLIGPASTLMFTSPGPGLPNAGPSTILQTSQGMPNRVNSAYFISYSHLLFLKKLCFKSLPQPIFESCFV